MRKLIKRYVLRHRRHGMRGYRVLRARGELRRIERYLTAVVRAPMRQGNGWLDRWFFGAAADHLDIATRQFLQIRLVPGKLPIAIYATFSGGRRRIASPMPRAWRYALVTEGLPLAHVRSFVLWVGFIILVWGYGALRALNTLKLVWRPTFGQPPEGYVFLGQVTSHHMPKTTPERVSYDYVSWLRANARGFPVHHIAHQSPDISEFPGPVGSTRVPFAVPLPTRFFPRLCFTAWIIAAVVFALLSACIGRWQAALFLSEAILARAAHSCDRRALATAYVMNNSSLNFRPLWSYEVVARGARLIMCFYSTNWAPFKRPWGYVRRPVHELLRWPEYWVWDDAQAAFTRQLVGDEPVIEQFGTIWFGEDPSPVPDFDGRAVAVFDVPPVRASIFFGIGLEFDYYHPDTVTKFIHDCGWIAEQTGVSMLWKQKRDRGKTAHPAYIAAIDEVNAKGSMIVVEPRISAHRVIEVSEVVISAPFTSTAYIARELGKPSCFYDAGGTLFADDKGAHGIPLIQGREALKVWLEAALKEAHGSSV